MEHQPDLIPKPPVQDHAEHLAKRLNDLATKSRAMWTLSDRGAVSGLLIELKDIQKALIVIENICLHSDEENSQISSIYKAVHVANDTCINPHRTWKKWVNDVYADLVASGQHREESKSEARRRLEEGLEKLDSLPSRIRKG